MVREDQDSRSEASSSNLKQQNSTGGAGAATTTTTTARGKRQNGNTNGAGSLLKDAVGAGGDANQMPGGSGAVCLLLPLFTIS